MNAFTFVFRHTTSVAKAPPTPLYLSLSTPNRCPCCLNFPATSLPRETETPPSPEETWAPFLPRRLPSPAPDLALDLGDTLAPGNAAAMSTVAPGVTSAPEASPAPVSNRDQTTPAPEVSVVDEVGPDHLLSRFAFARALPTVRSRGVLSRRLPRSKHLTSPALCVALAMHLPYCR